MKNRPVVLSLRCRRGCHFKSATGRYSGSYSNLWRKIDHFLRHEKIKKRKQKQEQQTTTQRPNHHKTMSEFFKNLMGTEVEPQKVNNFPPFCPFMYMSLSECGRKKFLCIMGVIEYVGTLMLMMDPSIAFSFVHCLFVFCRFELENR